MIKGFHRDLLAYVHKDISHRGNYKKAENRVEMLNAEGQPVGVVFETTPAYLTPKQMQELVDWTATALGEKILHPLLVIGNFVVEFLKIHPFLDGNGRLSRVLTNLLLLQQGYVYMPYTSHEKLIEDNKVDYYAALRESQKTLKTDRPDITTWLDFFLTTILEQSKMAVELLARENIDKLLSPKQLAVWEYMQSVGEATPKQITEQVGIARPTVNQVVDKLLRLKKIERIGLGRSTRYRKIRGWKIEDGR
jgi:Fic family protein